MKKSAIFILTAVSLSLLFASGCNTKAKQERQRRVCEDNLIQIFVSYTQAGFDGVVPSTVADLCGSGKYLFKEPVCPVDGSKYTIINGRPHCKHEDLGHVLPSEYR